jgi:hypothetical protein
VVGGIILLLNFFVFIALSVGEFVPPVEKYLGFDWSGTLRVIEAYGVFLAYIWSIDL